MNVLFLCTGNSCRSQMAEGLLRWVGGSIVNAMSAGTAPKPVHPLAVRAMSEIGVDISCQQPKSTDRFLKLPFDYVITLCDSARESCPIFPGAAHHLHWSLPDPAAATGTDDERMAAFRSVRDRLAAEVDELLADILEGFLSRMAAQADAAHADALQMEPA